MIKLSKLADYAVVIIAALDAQKEELVSSSVLSKESKLPEPTVAKVLKLLASAEIVVSIRGVKGGYKLTKPLDDIKISDVITSVDGPIALTACVETSEECCDFAPQCAMHGRWNQVNKAINDALDMVTVGSMMNPQKQKERA